MLWHFLNNKKIGIFGMGMEGTAAKNAVQKYAAPAEIIEISEDTLDNINMCDIIIKSPGVSLYRPEIQEAMQKGIQVTSGSNLFYANRDKNIKIIAVTGTKGKSTTSSLIAHTLAHLGANVELGGNIGCPLVELMDKKPQYIVVETSSYQCADLKADIDIAVLVSLYTAHVKWHDNSWEKYALDKFNMLKQARKVFLNRMDENTQKFTGTVDAPLYFNDTGAFHIKDGFFYRGDQKLFETAALPLFGDHNLSNACAVLSVLDSLGFDVMKAKGAFETFKSLPHRLEVIGEVSGITYINDSISTTPDSEIAALRAFAKFPFIALLAGGVEEKQNFEKLIAHLKTLGKGVFVIGLPDSGHRLAREAAGYGIATTTCVNVQEAVQYAKKITPAGGCVLLSPGAPSYNQYKNFQERGADFKKGVLT
ncbi:MAG: UDP-N-acetylmuramoyl-L-alanine--D-glutamate ligase [Lactobacillales bacterium]|jgi:UDP-N-acetylmuramoylalanine--D-glutamate ligase|nr:UDP-N-acetylmuramoyl-L-alanine--D-glutamate ligase [Lactobacillales bacterium]